jgi:hypothetical protein
VLPVSPRPSLPSTPLPKLHAAPVWVEVTPPCEMRTAYVWRILQGGRCVGTAGYIGTPNCEVYADTLSMCWAMCWASEHFPCTHLQYWLFTPELQ